MLAERLQELQPVHARHVEIGNHQMGGAYREILEGGRGVGGISDIGDANRFKSLNDQAATCRHVVDHKNLQ